MEILQSTPKELAELDTRLERVREAMETEAVDMLVLSSMENIYYLSNYQTVGGCVQVLLVTQDDIHIVTRELEVTNAYFRSHVPAVLYTEAQDPIQRIVEYIASKYTFKTVGLEYKSSRLSSYQLRELKQSLDRVSLDGKVTYKDISLLVPRLRIIKSPSELENLYRAAGMVSAGIQAAIDQVSVGMMETEIGGIVTHAMCKLGCEYPAYPVFLCSGPTGCLGHYTPTQKQLENNEILFLEIGGCYKRYHAARMYSVYIGDEVPEWFCEAERLIRQAVSVGKRLLKPGAVAKDVDKEMRDIIGQYPHPYKQSERAGYSIGIGFYTDWSEPLLHINPSSERLVQENMTLHLIPWIQIPGKGAIGFSDTVLVTKEGAVSLFDTHIYKRRSS